MVPAASDGRHGRPVDLVQEVAGEESQNLTFPSREHETTSLFVESTMMPVMAFVCLPVPGVNAPATRVFRFSTSSACLSCCILSCRAWAGVTFEGNCWR